MYRVGIEGPPVDWWVYEQQRAAITFGVAAAGKSADEIDEGADAMVETIKNID